MKRTYLTLILTIVILASLFISGCESCSRQMKSINSDINGGLNRIVSVYDYNGKLIKTYEGRVDIGGSPEGSGEILFDLNGKRTIINGGIVIIDEI